MGAENLQVYMYIELNVASGCEAVFRHNQTPLEKIMVLPSAFSAIYILFFQKKVS